MKLDGWAVSSKLAWKYCYLDYSVLTLMSSQQLEVHVRQFNGLERIVCADQLEDLKNRWEPIKFR
jgi:hypothetical protein